MTQGPGEGTPNNPLDDDLLAELGVVLRTTPPAKAKEKFRFTEWRDNLHTFHFTGYLARLRRVTCETCGNVFEEAPQVFLEETHSSGGRRLTALGPGGQWPTGVEHRLEVEQATSLLCPNCVRELGFSRESGPPGPATLVEGKGMTR